ncbi:MAG: hypothetical protein HY748_02485 [Elusimicrobia bacterium]|nr:hypothetical protein [Elusimicrobiota bacterium]
MGETSSADLGTLRAGGKADVPFSFEVPQEGPVSYDGKLLCIVWEVRVHVDVPWATDIEESFPVAPPPR